MSCNNEKRTFIFNWSFPLIRENFAPQITWLIWSKLSKTCKFYLYFIFFSTSTLCLSKQTSFSCTYYKDWNFIHFFFFFITVSRSDAILWRHRSWFSSGSWFWKHCVASGSWSSEHSRSGSSTRCMATTAVHSANSSPSKSAGRA